MQPGQQVLFSVDDEIYGFESFSVKYIEAVKNIVSIPGMPEILIGCVELRGEIIPVCSMRKCFGRQEKQSFGYEQIIFIEINGFEIGFLVDNVKEITDLSGDNVNIMPDILKSSSTGFVKFIVKHKNYLVSILDYNRILPEDDFEIIKNGVLNIKKEREEAEKAEETRRILEKEAEEKQEGKKP